MRTDKNQKLYIETYGCQMNVADSEVVVSILNDAGYESTDTLESADLIIVNTCSIRDNAEQRVWGRLEVFKQLKKKKPQLLIGVIGCMAERLKDELLEEKKMVDIVVGPDAYRDLPKLVESAEGGQKAINVLLSHDETYADICPVRVHSNNVSAFISIMRGCENMCNYCIVPYVRGKERSRNPLTIATEVKDLLSKGYREVTLLGQNVNSYNWGNQDATQVNFAGLLKMVASVDQKMRIRFSTSHPKDMHDEVLHVMAEHHNICKCIHLPLQSGSSRILEKMNRKYTREWYEDRIRAINRILPDCAVTTDLMVGFCGEEEADHEETLSLMKWAQFDLAFMFKYSERPGTYGARKMDDDVPEEVKSRRLTEVINLQNQISGEVKKNDLGKVHEVLVEGVSKKSKEQLFGRNSQNKVVVFPKKDFKIGEYVNTMVTSCTSATLIGHPV